MPRPLVISAVLFCILRCWASAELHTIHARTPSALVIPASEYFEGNDGPWSSFSLRVGEPAQDIRVLVSTASPESLVVLNDFGCSSQVFTTVPPNCAASRGNLFNPNTSSTYDNLGIYGINGNGVGLEANLGYNQRVQFAQETVGIGLNGPVLGKQVVGGIVTAYPFYLGIFGLNDQPVNLTALGNSYSPSFLTALKNDGTIPSLSWSYTAGAKYRLKQVNGQLIFSGYDTSRFTENSVSFTMAEDVTRDLVVVLQSISYSGSTTTTLLSDPINIFIDSTDPNIWLPEKACSAFEAAFGLTLDPASGLYLINETHHNALLDSNAEVTFRLSDVTSGGDSVRIVLPYGAFGLTAQPPLVNNTSYYFPLKRAANSTQYTLGRTFLQEAYLSVDYERKVFNVSACTWVQGAQQKIVTITSKNSNAVDPGCSTGNCSSSGGTSSLGGGAIAGIVIGAIAGIAIIGAIIYFLTRRRRQKQALARGAFLPEPEMSVLNGPIHNGDNNTPKPSSTIEQPKQPELDGDVPQIYQLHGESTGTNSHAHLDRPSPVYHELAGTEVERGRLDTDQVSNVSALPSHDDRETGGELGSPLVSAIGTNTWGDDRWGGSDLVSPTSPVRRSR